MRSRSCLPRRRLPRWRRIRWRSPWRRAADELLPHRACCARRSCAVALGRVAGASANARNANPEARRGGAAARQRPRHPRDAHDGSSRSPEAQGRGQVFAGSRSARSCRARPEERAQVRARALRRGGSGRSRAAGCGGAPGRARGARGPAPSADPGPERAARRGAGGLGHGLQRRGAAHRDPRHRRRQQSPVSRRQGGLRGLLFQHLCALRCAHRVPERPGHADRQRRCRALHGLRVPAWHSRRGHRSGQRSERLSCADVLRHSQGRRAHRHPGVLGVLQHGGLRQPRHVAGAFALLKQRKPAATVDELLTALGSTGVPIFDPRNGLYKPRIRLPAALDAIVPVAQALALSPPDGLSSSGPPGGPFSPASKSYTLTNSGVGDLNFTVSTAAGWATVSPQSGNLAQGASTTVTVTINGNAASLARGAYSSTVDFNNTTNGVGSASRTVALSVEQAPANDKFQDAAALPQSSGNTSGTNVGATKEAGEPNHAGQPGGRSVWWRWTAPSAGPASFDTLGSGFDTVLAAYTGNSVSDLVQIAANDNAPGTTRSRITFTTVQGQTYYIAVDGVAGTAGQIILNWAFGQDVVQPGDITVTPDSGFAASGPAGGPFTPSSTVYTLTNVSTGTRTWSVTGVPAWLTASATSGILTPGESTQVALSVHASAASLGAGVYSGSVSFNAAPRAVSLTVRGSSGSDSFANASALGGSSLTASGSNVGASKEPGEPDHGGPGGASMWWRWTAPASGQAIIDSFGSGFDTLLGVYTGSAVNALTLVAANNDAGGMLQSRVMFQAPAGVEYRIAVDGYVGATGPITLHIAAAPSGGEPSNNAFAAAIELSGDSVTAAGTNIGATKEPGEPNHAGNAGGASVWWKWTAPATRLVSIETFGSTFNTLLAVYTGSQVSGLTPVASNDDYGGGTQSKLTFQAQQGTTYFIAVDGYNNGFGPLSGGITLSLSVSIPVTPGTSAFVFFSHPGDWIGQGESRQIYADQAGVSITAARNFQQGVTVSIRTGAEWWDLNVGPPPGAGAPLAVGAYENAVRYPFNSGLTPGIDLSGNSRDCSSIRGRFDVLEAVYAVDGSVQRFAADFVQHCDGRAAALFGQIRFNSEVPLDLESALPAPFAFVDAVDVARSVPVMSNSVTISGITNAPISVRGGEYSIDGAPFASAGGTIANGQTLALRVMSSSLAGTPTFATVRIGAAGATYEWTTALGPQGTNVLYLHSQPGDFIGQGQQRAFHAGNGWTLTPSRNYHNGVSFTIQGPNIWSLDLAGPGRAQLAVGAYEKAAGYPFENGTSPGLSFQGEGRGRGETGRFEILEIAYAADGSVQRFAADFVQRCVEVGVPALFGQIRFNSNVPIYTDPVLPAPFAFVDAVDVPRSATITSDAVQISGI